MKRTAAVAASLAVALLGGCVVGPDYHAPKPAVPESWSESGDAVADGASPDGPWWRWFGDPVLDDLVSRAVAANTDVRVAAARLRESRAQRGVVVAALFPRADLSGSFSNSRFSENGFLSGLGGVGGGGGGAGGEGGGGLPGAIVPGQQINLWQAGVDASWEIDLFGRNTRALEAAGADIGAAEFGLGDALVAVAAEVAEGYVQLRGVQSRLKLARRTLASERETLSVLREQSTAGIASDLDVSRADTEVAGAAARVPDLEGAERVAVRRLEVLVGAMPGTLDEQLLDPRPIPVAPEALNAGIPSDVLRRRPDVRMAERRLAGATARIGVATADLFPRFSLTGSFGLQSQELGDLPEGNSRFWSLGPSVRWPILDFGRVRANIRVQDARSEQALAAYEGTVLRALSDVEVALVRLSRARARLEQLNAAAESARRSVALADELYRGGLLGFLDLLDVQRTLYDAEDALSQSSAAVVSDTVALFRALGGGWEPAGMPAP
jgi:NodT family efflux transporter outer membrane factor (OMF) lipoprotein